MSNLSKLYIFKIAGTICVWCLPLILFPDHVLEWIGFPEQKCYLFVQLLGWAYFALCVGYAFGFQASLSGRRLMGPIWVGIVSNGGACMYLLYYGATGAYAEWGGLIKVIAWGSAAATALITIGLFVYGVRGKESVVV